MNGIQILSIYITSSRVEKIEHSLYQEGNWYPVVIKKYVFPVLSLAGTTIFIPSVFIESTWEREGFPGINIRQNRNSVIRKFFIG